MSYFQSKAHHAALALTERRDFTNTEIVAIRHLAKEGANLRQIIDQFPLDVTTQTYRKKLLKLGIHVRRATSDIRCGDNVTIGNQGHFHDTADTRSFHPARRA